jgi:UDP-GlcNAc:undecaprenyl-phosphate/decaprenyl-phosphate GlcNAc-1-phosphate transferase
LTLHFLDWLDFHVFIVFSLAIVFFIVLHVLWPYLIKLLEVKKYNSIQRAHFYDAPRMGGLAMVLCTFFYGYFNKNPEIKSILGQLVFFFIPAFFFALKEDVYFNVKPLLRLLSLLVSAILFLNFSIKIFPTFNISVLDYLLFTPLGFLIYPLAIASVANGSNLLDGVNGLCSFVSFAIFLCILFLAYKCTDITLMIISFFFILQLLAFIIFNYPKGLVFLGDLGAYFLGFCHSLLLIILFSRNPELNYSLIFLILIYPLTEVIFTFFRRFFAGSKISNPDRLHLHLLVFEIFRPISHLKRYANNSVSPLLAVLWLYPFVVMPFVYKNNSYILLGIFGFILLYLLLYNVAYKFLKS